MEDFEYSVEISDRDWECFFAECEECNLLPPALAGVDDSGMSDIDDTGSILAKRAQKIDQTGFSKADRPIDGPPDCEGSPVEHYLDKHGVGGMESVLSGSEEDIHMQSVNIFFESLKIATEAERLSEPSEMRAGKNRESIQEEWCSDGQQASSSTLPKNIPKLNSLPARGETAVGKETTEPVNTMSNIMKTMKKYNSASKIFPESAASYSVLKTNNSAHPETKLFITEEACTETKVNEAAQRSQSHESPDGVETTPCADKLRRVEMYTPLYDGKQEDLLISRLTLGKKCGSDSWSNLETVTDVKPKDGPVDLQSNASSTNRTESQESSPSASIRRKRRKKRRLSFEPAESVQGYEKQVLVKQSDSEEERRAWRGGTGLCASESIHLFHLNEPQKNDVSSVTTHSATSNLPEKDINENGSPCHNQDQYIPESIVRHGWCKATGLAENNAANHMAGPPLRQTDDSAMSAPNNSANVTTHIEPCSMLHAEESSGLCIYPALPISTTNGITGKLNPSTEASSCGKKDPRAGNLQQSDKGNHSLICDENEQNPESCTTEVKSLSHSFLPSTKSNDPTMEVIQNDKLSAAKSVLAEEAGNSGRDTHTLCQREAEPQQQLEIDRHYTDHFSSTLEKTGSADGTRSSDAHNTKPKQFKMTAFPLFEDIFTPAEYDKSALDTNSLLSDKCLSSLDEHIEVQQTDYPPVLHTFSKTVALSEDNAITKRTESEELQIIACHSGKPSLAGEINQTGKSWKETKWPISEDSHTSSSAITPLSSYCLLGTESMRSLSTENLSYVSESSCISVNQNDGENGEKSAVILEKQEEGDGTSGPKSQSASSDRTGSKCDLAVETEDAVTTSEAECEPEKASDSKHSVFAMSSFWNDMEKLTINDILGLRTISQVSQHRSLPPLQESEEADKFSMMDSSYFTQPDESKPEQTSKVMPSDPKSVGSSSGSVTAVNSPSLGSVVWEREPVPVSLGNDIYTENMMLTSVCDISRPALPGNAQTCLRKICKNVSVHNLHALEAVSCTWKGQTLQTVNEGELEKAEYFIDGHMPEPDKDVDCLASSSTGSYRISLSDIFQYLFGGKQSNPTQSATTNITTCYADGNSVPETYDHFFSEFDTESFFYPLITAEDQAKDELVPIFSCSRSVNRSLQFPEAYDYFFTSSSSDESSDEEDIRGPVRVVNRFSRTSSASKISTDIYDNFFTDSDLKQNFFWKKTFSLRNISLTGSRVQKQTLSHSLVPVRQSSRSLRRIVHPINVLGNDDVMFTDPLLNHLEDRISRQLSQQSFTFEDLQSAVSNPRLDAPLLPLRHSDMCLVCIAFASWVLKTANPQVGDAWKAVLLANVSALSAIRYLRKYIKMQAAAGERKLDLSAPSVS